MVWLDQKSFSMRKMQVGNFIMMLDGYSAHSINMFLFNFLVYLLMTVEFLDIDREVFIEENID